MNNDLNNQVIVQTIEDIFLTILEADIEDPSNAIEFLSDIFDNNIIDINTHYDYDIPGEGGAGEGYWDNFLRAAVMRLNPRITQLLLDYGIDVNIRDPEGLTPLDILKFEGHEDILTLYGLTPYGLQKYMETRNIL